MQDMTSEDDISWYHGSLTREEAEEVLLNAMSRGMPSHGLFLVRDSSTTLGDFVLSVLNKGDIMNFQIRKHGDDAFFSINEETIVHGLETLIEYYKNDNTGLPCPLLQAVKKDPPPPHSRSHGRTNLLHRATKIGNFHVVSELLNCGYRNIEAKNQDGQTAVHIACLINQESILEKLIESQANLNCRDHSGNTPLHYACQKNFLNIVKILLNNGAQVQLRNTNTGLVPLHDAASRGYRDIVEHLLRVGAPPRPRTNEKKTPQHLAEENGYYPISQILKTHEGPKPKTTKEDWYHGTLSREEAVNLLKDTTNNTDGRFLVRFSENTGYVLTMMFMSLPYNYVISKEGKFFVIDDGPLLDSLEHVVEHYSTMSDGLPTILQSPVKPKPKPPLPSCHPSIFATLPIGGRKGHRWSEGTATMPIQPKPRRSIDSNMNPKRAFISMQDLTSQIFISKDSLIMDKVIGEGEFGSVYKAIYQTRTGEELEVAVKTLHPDHMTANREAFLKEAEVMMKLDHHCIVKLIGISQDSTYLMVQELIPLGSMLTYILKYPNEVSSRLPMWASQIACGMEYLESKKIVHRDLAARNILLATLCQAKISDFGLSRTLVDDREYYRATKGGRWPIKWYAPESYNFGTFSSASDVWSYGVTIWEMYSFGQQPFGELRGQEVIELIERGRRLEQPEHCPDEVYQEMEKCWQYHARDRPTFKELFDFFSYLINYENVRDLIGEVDIS